MMIEEAVLIKADREQVWKTFTDLEDWKDWNTTACDAGSSSGRIEKGEHIRFCLRPFGIPVDLEPVIDEVVEYERVVWSASKFGIASRHEFLFQETANGILVTSRERVLGVPLLLGGRHAAAVEIGVRKGRLTRGERARFYAVLLVSFFIIFRTFSIYPSTSNFARQPFSLMKRTMPNIFRSPQGRSCTPPMLQAIPA
jgi:uncharacterized protein YndB with AHSA1/START domain